MPPGAIEALETGLMTVGGKLPSALPALAAARCCVTLLSQTRCFEQQRTGRISQFLGVRALCKAELSHRPRSADGLPGCRHGAGWDPRLICSSAGEGPALWWLRRWQELRSLWLQGWRYKVKPQAGAPPQFLEVVHTSWSPEASQWDSERASGKSDSAELFADTQSPVVHHFDRILVVRSKTQGRSCPPWGRELQDYIRRGGSRAPAPESVLSPILEIR